MNAEINDRERLVIISPGYNCEKFIDLWWNSIKVQNYDNWICIAINDQSTDGTLDRLLEIAKTDSRLIVIDNKVKKYQLRNWYDVIHNRVCRAGCIKDEFIREEVITHTRREVHINDDDIIIFHDMDDWFGTKYAFELTVKEYIYRGISCTTARNFQLNDYYNHDAELYTSRDQLRSATTHMFSLFSYRARLFKKIPVWHFIDPRTNKFYEVCGDYAITMPILYEAGPNCHQHMFVDNFIIYNNIRLECDDNKVIKLDIGVKTAHEIARESLTQSFRRMIDDGQRGGYCKLGDLYRWLHGKDDISSINDVGFTDPFLSMDSDFIFKHQDDIVKVEMNEPLFNRKYKIYLTVDGHEILELNSDPIPKELLLDIDPLDYDKY